MSSTLPTVLYYIVLYCILYYIILYYIILYYIILYYIILYYIILYYIINVAAYFNQLYGHPQATRARKSKITIANFILGQNEITVCCIIRIDWI